MPCRWMAPEALVQQESNTRSDVWSYGVLLWEVWGLGHTRPYTHISTPATLLHRLAYGERLPQPVGYVRVGRHASEIVCAWVIYAC